MRVNKLPMVPKKNFATISSNNFDSQDFLDGSLKWIQPGANFTPQIPTSN